MLKKEKRLLALLICCLCFALGGAEKNPVDVLLGGLRSPAFWTRVHAAEYLLALKIEQKAVLETFRADEERNLAQPFTRIGHHRVMIRLGDHISQREAEIHRIASDENAPDRLHAVETIGKLQYAMSPEIRLSMERLWHDKRQTLSLRCYAAWCPGKDEANRETFLRSNLHLRNAQTDLPGCAIAGLSYFASLSAESIEALRQVFNSPQYPAAVRLSAAELLLSHNQIAFSEIQNLWQRIPHKRAETKAYCRILSKQMAIPTLKELLNNSDCEISMSAAYALWSIRKIQ